jgi:mRNA interferase MazF
VNRSPKRGDIVTVAVGSGFGGKPRPALVVQNNDLATFPNLVVVLFSSDHADVAKVRPVFEPDKDNGLKKPSELMADIVVTAPRHKVDKIIGRLSPSDLRRAEMALLYVLGFS